jgi:DNA adenine methylase
VRDNVDGLIRELRKYVNDEEFYYGIRALNSTELSELERAARTIYLNKTCFNGLCTMNHGGRGIVFTEGLSI